VTWGGRAQKPPISKGQTKSSEQLVRDLKIGRPIRLWVKGQDRKPKEEKSGWTNQIPATEKEAEKRHNVLDVGPYNKLKKKTQVFGGFPRGGGGGAKCEEKTRRKKKTQDNLANKGVVPDQEPVNEIGQETPGMLGGTKTKGGGRIRVKMGVNVEKKKQTQDGRIKIRDAPRVSQGLHLNVKTIKSR